MAVGLAVHIGDERSTASVFSKVFADGRQRVAITCSRCQFQETHGSSVGIPAARVAKNFRSKGWDVDRKCRVAICPGCLREESIVKQSPEAIRAQAKLFAMLEEHYDPEKKRFRTDWSDDKVSKACGLSVDQVSVTRESLYGPMIDPVVAKAEAEIDRIQAQLTELESLVKTETAKLRTELAKVRGALQRT